MPKKVKTELSLTVFATCSGRGGKAPGIFNLRCRNRSCQEAGWTQGRFERERERETEMEAERNKLGTACIS